MKLLVASDASWT